MHLDGRSRLRFGTASNRLCRCLAVLFPATLVGSLFGQSYLAPPPGFQGAPAVPAMGNISPGTSPGNGQLSSKTIDQINQQANGPTPVTGQGTSAASATSATPSISPGTSATPATGDANAPKEAAATGPLAAPMNALARWGAVHIHPHASYQFLYATGIHNRPGNNEDTYTHTISPGVLLDLGPHVTLDYTPSFRFYSEKDFHNTVDHSLDFHAGYNVGDWTLGLSQGVLITDDPLVETSGQVERSEYNTGLFASYNMNDKVTLATTASMELSNASGGGTNVFVGGTNGAAANLTDSKNYNAGESLDYKFNDKLSGGLQVSFGYTEQAAGFRSIEESFGAHAGWHPASKFSATISAGLEQRTFLDSKADAAWNPIYSATIDYHMFEQTALSIYASRSTDASLFNHQFTETTALGVGLQQRLLGKLHLALGFAYNQVDYLSTDTANLSQSRSDDGTSFTAGLTVPFLKRCNFAAFYQYSQNNSSQAGFSYDSSQIGATLSWSY